ncbi:MAG: alpha/beta hydrolase family protein [Armatimonadota bacterium]
MKEILRFAVFTGILLALTVAASAQEPARSIEGVWKGTLKTPGGDLRVVVHLNKGADGAISGTMDSLDQGATGIPINSGASLDGDKVFFEIKVVQGFFKGTLSDDGDEMKGEWTQGGIPIPLTLKRTTESAAAVKRPQEPKPPFPYTIQDVTYQNKGAGITLAGTLTLPKGKGPFPAAIMITGSGPQDRDESLMGHKPFLVIADYLTRRGIAVLRVDDRGVGGSTGDIAQTTTEDFASDVISGVQYLKTRKEINPKRIGLIGHSEGGLVAPLAAVRSKDVAYIVLMAGTGVTGEEILYKQGELIARAMGAPEADIQKQLNLQKSMFAVIKQEKDPAEAEKKLKDIVKQSIVESIPAGTPTPPIPDEVIDAQIKSTLNPWFRFFLTFDPRPVLAKVKVPVLAINGEKDLQVPPKQNIPEIQKALKSGGNKDVTTKILPGLNHLFQPAKTGAPTEYAQIETTISPTVLKIIGDWIVKHTIPAK